MTEMRSLGKMFSGESMVKRKEVKMEKELIKEFMAWKNQKIEEKTLIEKIRKLAKDEESVIEIIETIYTERRDAVKRAVDEYFEEILQGMDSRIRRRNGL